MLSATVVHALLFRGLLVRRCPRLSFSWLPVASLALRSAPAAHGGSPFWCPRGLALVLLCSLRLPSPLPLARSAFFALLFGAPRPRFASCLVVMSCDLSTPPGPLHPPPRPPRLPVPRSLRPTPMTNGTRSSTHTASPRLLVAPRPPSPSRPTPLVLVGVLATNVAVASAKPPSAPCGERFDVLSPVLCAFSAGAALLFEGLLWVRAHFCRWLWVWSWTRAHF